MISVREAQQLILGQAKLLPAETILLENALGRTLAENIFADRSYPPFNRAAMDGYAFKSADLLYNGHTQLEIVGELFAGHAFEGTIKAGQCIKIMTGAAAPPELDCIVQVELSILEGKKVSFPDAKIKPWQNIAIKGEDCKEGDSILSINTQLGPTEIATLAVLGKKAVAVRRLPKIAILSTGDELVPVGDPVTDFQIRDSNAYALAAFFQNVQAPIEKREIVKDEPAALKKALQQVLDFDIIVLSGGVSMGDADYVPSTLQKLGVEKIFHKVRLKPGKPLWFGKTSSGGAVFGLPGNPLSCQVCFKLFIQPYLAQSFGLAQSVITSLPITFGRKKKVKLDEYFPVKFINGQLHSIAFNGSGDVTSTIGSTGIALHPFEKEDLQTGEEISYLSWI